MKVKNVRKHTVKKGDTLFSSTKKKKKKKNSMKSIKSHNHNIKSYDITKCRLSCFDNKRYILKDKITTLAYGHNETENITATWQET